MHTRSQSWMVLLAMIVVAAVSLISCGAPAPPQESASTAANAPAQEVGGQEEFGPYDVVPAWEKPHKDESDGVKHDGWTFGSVGAVWAENPNRIWVAMRGELPLPMGAKPWTPYGMLGGQMNRGNATGNPDGLSATCETTNKRGWERRMHHVIYVLDGQGNQIQWWQDKDKDYEAFCGRGPHKIKMSPYDPDKHVWVIDDQLHLIHKYTYDGKEVLTLGTKGKRGRDAGVLFDRPTDIDWLPDGTFFISDGYGGTRVAKFDPAGKFLMDWGEAPKDPNNPGPNEWNTVHSIGITADRRLFVVDRGHRRFQVYDENGKFLTMFPTGRNSSPYYHYISTDQYLWVGDGGTNRILKYDLDGHYLYGWGGMGGGWGMFSGPHQLAVDQDRNLYVAEVFNGRVQKFTPKANADPAKVAGQEKRFGTTSTN